MKKFIPFLSALAGAILLVRAAMPVQAAPAPCHGASAKLQQAQCAMVVKGGL
ncbi:MAG: hypothetical protein FD175_1255 [Beijerinckiaceae bacterium]|nr:MAG: hypothetical protein FD175_1255 [Beijerinckiaceae bacterium]